MTDTPFNAILLEKEQIELFYKIVEASRNLPRENRSEFLIARDSAGDYLIHDGLPNGEIEFYYPDLEILNGYNLLQVTSYNKYGITKFDVHPLGYKFYKKSKINSGEPINRIEKEIRNYLNAYDFQKEYSKAYEKWSEADNLLRESDTTKQLTKIGHSCREAIIEYIDNLVDRISPPHADPNKAKTKSRIKSILEYKSDKLGKSEKSFLDALYDFWESVIELILRQVHGAEREREELVWEDGRRVVFQTMIVMYEIDKALKRTK